MTGKRRLGVSEAHYLKPLLDGLEDPQSPFTLTIDIPASLAVTFNERPDVLWGAFLSPVDYGRRGGNYQIVPGICASSKISTGTIQLYINKGVSDITTMAVDVRVTSEIVLARILLLERFQSLSKKGKLEVIPMMPAVDAMLSKADAAIVVNLTPSGSTTQDMFSIDLVEEWEDMTGLPYVHGFWVVREDVASSSDLRTLLNAKERGTRALESPFSYDFGQEEQDSLSEFLRYCYFHGILRDVPELNFSSPDSPSPAIN